MSADSPTPIDPRQIEALALDLFQHEYAYRPAVDSLAADELPLLNTCRVKAQALAALPVIAAALARSEAIDALQVVDGEVSIIEGHGRSVIFYAPALLEYLRAVGGES